MRNLLAAETVVTEFRELAAYINAGESPLTAMRRITELARTTVACDEVAITRMGPTPRTLAATGDIAQAVDNIQISCGEGPCLDAARSESFMHAPDLRHENRWPTFARLALEQTPVRSILAFELDTEGARSSLNLYADRPGAFDDPRTFSLAVIFSTQAQLTVAHLNATVKSANLRKALETNRQIGTALGILMFANRVSEEQAFAMLKHSSQHLNRKLRDIAEDVTRTGSLPELAVGD